MEVYIDDMLVKSTTTELHIAPKFEAFQILREYNMKLNPAKCAFGVSAEKFLGFIINNRGIEANPDKIDECLKHSYYTRVSLAFSCCFSIIYIVLGVRPLIMCLF